VKGIGLSVLSSLKVVWTFVFTLEKSTLGNKGEISSK